jgi:hypothetical protein
LRRYVIHRLISHDKKLRTKVETVKERKEEKRMRRKVVRKKKEEI